MSLRTVFRTLAIAAACLLPIAASVGCTRPADDPQVSNTTFPTNTTAAGTNTTSPW